MNECSKCGSKNISGPKYSMSAGGHDFPTSEALIYTCNNCGYGSVEMTLQQKKLAHRKNN